MKRITTIDLPHKILERVGKLLEQKGFVLGTVGGGYGQMELDGTLTDEERTDLTSKMAAIVFEFEEYDPDEESGGYIDPEECKKSGLHNIKDVVGDDGFCNRCGHN